MELTGKVIAVLVARSGSSSKSGNAWMVQEYVVEIPGQYPKRCMFAVFGEDRIKQFNIQAGEDITVQFDIDAREYNGRWYNDIRAYNVIKNQQIAQSTEKTMEPSDSTFPPKGEPSSNNGGDLPF
jgi:hypothetical protein